MALLPLQDPTPQLVGPRAYAQRRQAAMENVAQDPRKWFAKFLQQYGVKGGEGKATIANPRSTGEYLGAAKRLDRSSAEALAMGNVYTDRLFGSSAPDPLGIGNDPFLQQTYKNMTAPLIEKSGQGSRTLRLGAQVFGGGPGEFTDMRDMWNKALAQQQSIGGTFYSEAGAAQAAMGSGAFLTQAKSELAAPLDSATAMQADWARTNEAFRRFRDEIRIGEDMRRNFNEQTLFSRGPRKGQAYTTKDPILSEVRAAARGPQRATGMIGRIGR